MFLGKPFAGLVMFGLFCLLSGTAYSQQVLVCYTLHNDLVNFDRRAHSVNHYFMPELGEAREAALGQIRRFAFPALARSGHGTTSSATIIC